MTPYTLNEYRRLRSLHPDLSAQHILTWAKAPMPHALDWDENGDTTIGTATIEGWDVEATIRDDYDIDASDTYGTLTNDWERGAFPNPYWREWHKDDPIAYDHANQCRSRHDDDGAARWYIPSSGQTMDELRTYFRHSGVARHETYTRALAQLRAEADDCRTQYQDWTGRYSFAYVVVTVSLAGVEVSSSSYGGYSWERDYSKPLDPQLDAIVDDAVREALAEAPSAVETAAEEKEREASALLARVSALRTEASHMLAGLI